MADESNVLTQEQRDFYENEKGKPLPEGATWDSLDGEQKAVLSDVYAPKSAEAEEYAGKFKEPEQEAAVIEQKEPMKLEDAINAADGKELYNLNPNDLAEMNNVLRTAAAEGNEAAVLGYGKVRLAMEEKMQAYANGEIETPIEWAGGMQAMLRAAKERLPEKEPYQEEPITGMHTVTAQNISNDKDKNLDDLSLHDLAALKVEMDKNPEGFDKQRVDEAVGHRLNKLASMGKNDFIAKEDLAAAQVLLDAIPMSNRRESAGKAFEVFTKVEGKLYDSRKVVNGTFDEPRIAELAEACEGKLKEFTEAYDKEHGLSMMTSEDAERVSENIAAMSEMGKDALDKAEYKEEPVKPMSKDEAEKAMAELRQGKDFDMKTLASLSASNAFGTMGSDAEALEKAIAAKLTKVGKEVPADELGSMDFLLEKASHLPESMFPAKKYEKAKGILDKNRKEAQKNPKPKHPEMADAMALFDNLEITDGVKMTGKAKSKDNDELKAQLLESIRLQTMESMAGAKPGPIDPAEFNKEFAANIVAEVGRLAGVESVIAGGSKAIEDYAKGHKIQVGKGALLGYLAAQSEAREGFAARLESKVGKGNAGVAKLREQGKSLDDKTAKNAAPKQYAMLKSLAKTAAWSGAYYAAGAVCGPAGIAVVATASLANQALKLRKEYKKKKEEMAKKGKKLKLWSFLKNNKMALAGAAMTALGIGAAGIEAAELVPEVARAMTNAKATSGIALGIGSTIKAFREVRKNGGSMWKAMGAASVAGAGTAWAVISGATSSFDSPAIEGEGTIAAHINWGEHSSYGPEHPTMSEIETANSVTPAMVDENNNGISDYIERPAEQQTPPMLDKDNDGISDYIDRDGGEGWANEPEKPAVEQEAPVQETPLQEPVVQQESEERPDWASQPLEAGAIAGLETEQPDIAGVNEQMQAQAEANKIYGVQDPVSGKTLEFSLGDNGEIQTHNAEEIGLVGSEQLHGAVAERISQEAGHFSDRELAFLEKNLSGEQYSDVMLADAQIRAEQDTQLLAQEAEKTFGNPQDVHTAEQSMADNQSAAAGKPDVEKLNEELQSMVHGDKAAEQQPQELSKAEKLEALRQGKSVEEATAAKSASKEPIMAQNINRVQTPINSVDPRGGGYTA